jgi:hypothetical protein
MTDLNLAMVLSLKDKLLGPLSRAVDQVERDFKDLELQSTKTARASGTMGENLAKVGKAAASTRQAATEMRKLGDEASRANREVDKLEKSSGRLRGLMQGMAKGVAGTLAFNHVVAEPLRAAADYDTQLRRLSNTAYAGKPLAERRAGMSVMNDAITAAVRGGGGTRDSALSALQEMVGGGQFGDATAASDLLPMIMRAATASGADPKHLVSLIGKAKGTMGITSKAGMVEFLDRAMTAGDAGGFELPDMAQHLPSQMAYANQLGLQGQAGATQLLALNQASLLTSGSRDEAARNLNNLLAKIISPDTANDFKKLGIDSAGSLAKAQGNGMNVVDAFMGLVGKVVDGDPRFANAKAKADAAKGTDKQAAYEAQADLFKGTAIGTVIQDQQARMALVAIMSNRAYLNDVTGKINNSKGSIDSAASLITEGPGYAFDQRNFDREKAQTDALSSANEVVMKLAEAQTDLYRKYPGFAMAVEGATVAVTAFAAAAGAAGIAGLLTRGPAGLLTGGAAAGSFAAGATATGATVATAATGALALGATAALVAPLMASVNPNREFVGAVADPSMVGSADFAGALAESMAQTSAAVKAASERPIQVNVHLDGRQIETSVTKRQDAKARRE